MPYQPTEPYFRFQSYLSGRYEIGQHHSGSWTPYLGVDRVWQDYRGANVTVGIVGFPQASHWDLRANYDHTAEAQLNPAGAYRQLNGFSTALAGTVAADDNGRGLVGVAPDAHVAGFGMNLAAGITLLHADVLVWYSADKRHDASTMPVATITGGRGGRGAIVIQNNAELTSISENHDGSQYGSAGDRHIIAVNGLGASQAVDHHNGRNEMVLTSVMTDTSTFWYRGVDADSNNDGIPDRPDDPWYDSGAMIVSGDVIPTLTLDDMGKEGLAGPGENIDFGVFPILAETMLGVNTKELLSGDLVANFGGQQGSAVAAGVTALMLDANDRLGWRDVQTIIAHASHWFDRADMAPDGTDDSSYTHRMVVNGAATHNGGGLAFSDDGGFGMLSAHDAVRLAETWRGTADSRNEATVTAATSVYTGNHFMFYDDEGVPGNPAPVEARRFQISVNRDVDIETLDFHLDAFVTHNDVYGTRGDASGLSVVLISPGGQRWQVRESDTLDGTDIAPYQVADTDGWSSDRLNKYFGTFDGDWSSRRFLGENARGTWTVELRPYMPWGDTYDVRIDGMRLEFHGGTDRDDTYVFNADWSRQSGRVIRDGAGFNDINASPLTDALVLTAQAGQSGYVKGERLYTLADTARIHRLVGGDGNDRLVAASDHATALQGGRGDDTYVATAGTSVIERAGQGTDTVQAFASHRLAANVENLRLMGSAALNGIGNEQANWLLGNAGANVLDGRGGADTLAGGGGDDTYVVGAGDVIREGVGQGVDTVRSDISWALAVNLERLVLTGTGSIAGTGNAGANTIIGNAGNNRLDGLGGADTLMGGAGDDLYVTDGGDVLWEAAGAGIDTVRSSVSIGLAQNLENLVLTGTAATGTGNALANAITGNAAANWLSGEAGNDTLTGGAGADRFIFAAGGGSDRITDFQDGIDRLVIRSGAERMADLTITNAGNDAVVRYAGGTITLEHLDYHRLTAADFVFV